MTGLTQGMNGKKVKLIDNRDGTHSISTRAPAFPTTVKIPKKTEIIKSALVGYALFVDHEDNVYHERNGYLYMTPDGVTETEILRVADLDATVDRVSWFCRTVESGKYILSLRKHSRQKGQIWTADTLAGPWTKKLDVMEIAGLGDSEFRPSNCWHHYDGTTDIVLVGTYGVYEANTNPLPCNHLYMSMDEGVTFTKILELPIVTTTVNNHIHSVSYSPWDGWIWVTHGDGTNRGIMYSYDLGVSWVAVSAGEFGKGGWQPTAVVPLLDQVAFGTDNPMSNGVLTWNRPGTTKKSPVGYAWQKLNYDGRVLIARKAAQISAAEAYIPMVEGNHTSIVVTGDGGFSWHSAITLIKGFPFELGFTNPDSQGYVWGANMMRFKVTEWEDVTKWVENKHLDYPY